MRRVMLAILVLALAGFLVSLAYLMSEAIGSAATPFVWRDSRGLLLGIPIGVYDVLLYLAIAAAAAAALAVSRGRRRATTKES